MRLWSFVIAVLVVAHESVNVVAQAPANSPAVEQGRQAVGDVCVACHANILRMVQAHQKTADEWRDTIFSMIGRGAQVLPEEIEPMTAFLLVTSSARRQATAAVSQRAPEGEGGTIHQRACQRCHDLATASTKPPSADWKAVIARMMTYGVVLTPPEQETLIKYLNELSK